MNKNPLLRKGLVVGIILLFVATGIIPTNAHDAVKPSQLTSSGHWLYVGGSGPGNYTRIQDAIDNASDGDTVFVYSGVYFDVLQSNWSCVYIDKSISLVGEDKNTTIIGGSFLYHVLGILADNVTVQGFTIQHSGFTDSHLQDPSGVSVYSPGEVLKNICVHDTIISENNIGLRVFNCTNSTFYNNEILQNGIGCSLMEDSCYLHHNYIHDNDGGISTSLDVFMIEFNTIRNNTQGFFAYNSAGIIRCNNFINNFNHAMGEIVSRVFGLSRLLFRIQWDRNYWDNWLHGSPKPIIGTVSVYTFLTIPGINPIYFPLGTYPVIQFDWHPAKEPYDIPE